MYSWLGRHSGIAPATSAASLPVAILIGLCAGCSQVASPYTRPVIDVPAAPAAPVIIEARWWKAFNDPNLDSLIDEALAHNYDLAVAAANVAEARANLGVAQSQLWPRVDAKASTGISKHQLTLASESEIDERVSTTAIGAAASWEVDLWGRIGQMNEAALARLSASKHARNATQLSISTATAETYFQLRNLDSKLEIMRSTLVNLRAVSDFEYRRWKAQVGTALAYRQSLAEVASVAARLPQIESARARTELALKLLAGRTPRIMAEPLSRSVGAVRIPDVPREVDSRVLLRRPDVASAERLLAAAHADVNSIRAEHYPRLTLSVAAGWIASSSNLISGWPLFWDAGAGLLAPMFDAGLIDSKAAAGDARRQKAITHYEYVTATAFREAYEALILIDTGDQQARASAEEVDARRQALVLDEKSYEVGRTSKYEVLSQTIEVLNAELTLADAHLAQLLARSRYYKALGGGF